MFEPKCKPAHFLQINQLKLKRETKVSHEEAFLNLYLAMKPLHCTVKLLAAYHSKTCFTMQKYSILQLNYEKYLWKLVPLEPCCNMLDCFTYINISHLNTRVNLIALTKFHCLNCTKNFRKTLYLHRNLFLGVLRDCYRHITLHLDNFIFIPFTPLLFFA